MNHCRKWFGRTTVLVIDGFTDWFTSARAFAQGTIVTIVWLALVLTGLADHKGWWLLFALTVFSGVTQFPLAYAARRAAEEAHRAGEAAMRQEEAQIQMLRNQQDTLRAILSLTEVTADAVGGHSEELDMLIALVKETEGIAARVDENERQQTELLRSRSEMFQRIDSTLTELAQGLYEDARRRKALATRISDIAASEGDDAPR